MEKTWRATNCISTALVPLWAQMPTMSFGSPSWDVHLGLGWTMAEGVNGVAT